MIDARQTTHAFGQISDGDTLARVSVIHLRLLDRNLTYLGDHVPLRMEGVFHLLVMPMLITPGLALESVLVDLHLQVDCRIHSAVARNSASR